MQYKVARAVHGVNDASDGNADVSGDHRLCDQCLYIPVVDVMICAGMGHCTAPDIGFPLMYPRTGFL